MHITNILRILGLLLIPFSGTMLPPIAVALYYGENTIPTFLLACVTTFLFGLLFWLPFKKYHHEVRAKEGFLIVNLLWITLSVMGALPFIFSQSPAISLFDAIFESVSGLTTTGATILSGLDFMPKSLLYYRQQLQFIGGGGIILLAVAILPMLSVGGMQLFRAEMSGPFKEDKLTPRITHTAKTLWMIYVGLVIACAFSYWIAGMNAFDAIGHSFSTISTGGFSTHDLNLAHYNNSFILLVGAIFMILGSINFSLHFIAFRQGSLRHYGQDPELRFFFILIFIMAIIVSIAIIHFDVFDSTFAAVTESFFQVIAFSTTAGFFSATYSNWPTFVPILLLLLCLVGGCAGSTAGGIKIIRILLLNKQSIREIRRLIHPNGHYIIKLGQNPLHYRTLDAIWGFLGIFVATFMMLLLLLLATGLDFMTAFSSLASTLSGTGLGLGDTVENFKSVSDDAKLLLCLAMLLGRLELFTILVLLSPGYWKQ